MTLTVDSPQSLKILHTTILACGGGRGRAGDRGYGGGLAAALSRRRGLGIGACRLGWAGGSPLLPPPHPPCHTSHASSVVAHRAQRARDPCAMLEDPVLNVGGHLQQCGVPLSTALLLLVHPLAADAVAAASAGTLSSSSHDLWGVVLEVVGFCTQEKNSRAAPAAHCPPARPPARPPTPNSSSIPRPSSPPCTRKHCLSWPATARA